MKTTTYSMYLFLAAFALSAMTLTGCTDPTEGKTDAIVGDAVEDPATDEGAEDGSTIPAALTGRKYVFAEDTTIFFEGYKTIGAHNGEFLDVVGSVVVPEEDITRAQVELTIDMTTFEADEDALTEKLKSKDFFEVETYPEARFKSTKIVATDEGYDVSGNLTMKGITKNITFPATIELDGDTLTASAEFTIKRFDWNIEYKGVGDGLVEDKVLLFFDVEATAAEEA